MQGALDLQKTKVGWSLRHCMGKLVRGCRSGKRGKGNDTAAVCLAGVFFALTHGELFEYLPCGFVIPIGR